MARKKQKYRPTFIRQWRNHRGLTLEKLADRVDMTTGALSMLERGERGYSQPGLEALAEALMTDPASLLRIDPTREDAAWTLAEHLKKATPEQKETALRLVDALLKTGT